MKIHKGIIALFAVALLGVGLVSAYNGWMNTEDHELVESAIESNNYNAWVQAHESLLTRDNFNLAVQRHKNMGNMHVLMEQLREAQTQGDEELVFDLQEQISELRPDKKMGCPFAEQNQKMRLNQQGMKNSPGCACNN